METFFEETIKDITKYVELIDNLNDPDYVLKIILTGNNRPNIELDLDIDVDSQIRGAIKNITKIKIKNLTTQIGDFYG